MGDFNAHVGTDTDMWKGVIGKNGVTGLDENGRYSLHLCCGYRFRIINTFFQHRVVHQYIWYRSSMDLKFGRFLHSFVRFVFWCAGSSSETRCWIVNRLPSRSMFLLILATLAKQEIQQVVCSLQAQTGGYGGHRSKKAVYIQCIDNLLVHSRISRRTGCCSDQKSFH